MTSRVGGSGVGQREVAQPGSIVCPEGGGEERGRQEENKKRRGKKKKLTKWARHRG